MLQGLIWIIKWLFMGKNCNLFSKQNYLQPLQIEARTDGQQYSVTFSKFRKMRLWFGIVCKALSSNKSDNANLHFKGMV